MNQDFDDFKRNISAFSNWLASIPPYEFSLAATIIAYMIAPSLSTSEQNAFGDWLEQVGQILLTISAQSSATPTKEEYEELEATVKRLQLEVENLKNRN